MPIGGGYFTMQNKVLPGAYINFVSSGGGITAGDRGIAALGLELDWGEENKIIIMEASEFNKAAQATLGYDVTAPELLLVRECMKRAKTLLLYRVNSGGQKATATIGGIAVTARHTGTRGNALQVAILVNADDDSTFDVLTFLDLVQVDSQTVTSAAELRQNDFVTFGAGTLTSAAATPLAGGTNGSVTGASHTAFLNAVEVETFNVIGYCGTDEAVKALYKAFTIRLIEDEGKKITCVLSELAADHEGIINIKNGVKLADGTVVPKEHAVAWVTGATAAAAINESLTNAAYDDAVDVDQKYTKGQYEAAINAGEFAFYADAGKARVLADINSLTTFGGGKTSDWTSNRVIRVLNNWANDVARIFGERYSGSETNDAIGRDLFKADLVSLALQYQGIRAIAGFVPDDITIEQGTGKRDVAAAVKLMPQDAMEKLYMIVTVI